MGKLTETVKRKVYYKILIVNNLLFGGEMQKITKYSEILNLISKVKKNNLGYVTNFYYDESKTNFLAISNRLFYEEVRDSFIILRKHLDFFYLFFIAPGYEKLETSLKQYLKGNLNVLVVDLLGKGEDLVKSFFTFRTP